MKLCGEGEGEGGGEGGVRQGRGVCKVENGVRRYQGRKGRREKKTAVERKLHHSNSATTT